MIYYVQRHVNHRAVGVPGGSHNLAISLGMRALFALLTVVVFSLILSAPAGAHEYIPPPPQVETELHAHSEPTCLPGYTVSVEPSTGDVSCLGPYENGYTSLCVDGVLIDAFTCQWQTGTNTETETVDVWIVTQAAYQTTEDQGYYVTDIVNECTTVQGCQTQAEFLAANPNFDSWEYGMQSGTPWDDDLCWIVYSTECMFWVGDPWACQTELVYESDITTCADVPVETWVPVIVTIDHPEQGYWETQTTTVETPIYSTGAAYLGCLPGWVDNGDGCTNPQGVSIPPSAWYCPSGWIPTSAELLDPNFVVIETTLCWAQTTTEAYAQMLEDLRLDSYEAQRVLDQRSLNPSEVDQAWALSWDQFDDRWQTCWDESAANEGGEDDSAHRRGVSFIANLNPLNHIDLGSLVPDSVGAFLTDGLMCVAVVVFVPDQHAMSTVLSGSLSVDTAFVSFSECTYEPSSNDSCVTKGFLSAPAQALNAAAAGSLDCQGPNLPIATMIDSVRDGLPDDNPLHDSDLSSEMDDDDFYPASGCEGSYIHTAGNYIRDPLSWLIAAWCIWTLMRMGRRMVVGG